MLTVKSLSISLRSGSGNSSLLRDINFTIKRNRIYSIVGKNGAGKSTLIKGLSRLLPEDLYDVSGTVVWNGSDIYSLTHNRLMQIRRTEIKYVFQETNDCFDDLRKLNYYIDLTNAGSAEIDPLLDYFMLPDHQTLGNKYPYELSGGMAQRLNLVLALLYKPKLIILDEPTSSVDPPMVNLIMFKLKEYLETTEAAVLIITHDLLLALRFGDKISFLSRGGLSEFKDPDEFVDGRYDDRLASFLGYSKEMDEY